MGLKDKAKRDKLIAKQRQKHGAQLVDSIIDRAELRKELKSFANAVGHYKDTTIEAVAEYISKYVVDNANAKKLAPKFTDMFENMMKVEPLFDAAIKNAQKSYEKYDAMDPRQKLLSNVKRDEEVDGFIKGIVRDFKEGTLFSNMIDSTKYIRDLTKELEKVEPNLKGKDSPIHRVLSLLGADGKAKQWLENHPVMEVNGELKVRNDVKPLFKIFEKMIKDGTLEEHEGYMVALRNIELYKNGKGSAATNTLKESEVARDLFERDLGKDYAEEFVKDLRKYNEALIDYYAQSGKLSGDVLKAIKEMNQYYVPFQRFFEEWEMKGQMPNVSTYVRDSSPSVVKKIKGSERDIVSPMGAIIKNTYDLIAAADRNVALRTIIDAMNKIDTTLADKIPGRTFKRVNVIAKPQIKIDPESGMPYLERPEKFTEERTAVVYEKPRNTAIVTVFENGKPVYYEVPKEYYQHLFSVTEPVSKAIKVLGGPSRLLQAGAVVYDPTFSVRNIIRDQISALFYSKYGYRPFVDLYKGVKSIVKKDEIYQKFLASGADQSFLTAMDQMLTKNYLEERAGKRIQTTWQRYRRNPIEILRDFNRATELGTRVGAFRKAYLETGDALLAMKEGREITADYGVKGQMMRNISPLYPFLNARTQHARRTAESIKENPKRVLMLGLPIMAESLVLWLANNSSEERKHIIMDSQSGEDMECGIYQYLALRIFLPLPKGFFGQLFGTGPEAVLDWVANNDPKTIKALASELFKEYSPLPSPVSDMTAYSPQFMRPALEVWANKRGFVDKPIISERLKGEEPYKQYTDATSEFAKFLGKRLSEVGIDVAPLKIDHFLAGYTAGAGRGVFNINDEILELAGIVDPSGEDTFTKLSRLPLVKAFVTETPTGTRSQYVEDFYQRLDNMEVVSKTVNNYIIDNKGDELQEYLSDEERDKDYRFYVQNITEVNRFRDVLRAVRDLRFKIYKNPEIKNKREVIDKIENEVTDMALAFKDAYDKNQEFRISDYLFDVLQGRKYEQKVEQKEIKRFRSKYK